MLPHLAGRPLTLKRFPEDIHHESFWEKDAPSFTPKWIERLPTPRKHESGVINYIGINNLKALRWAASFGCVEIHSFLHRYPYISSPTLIAFDLDPGEGTDVLACCEVAVLVKQWFSERGLKSFPKVSGSKGIQVYVPLNTPTSYAITQPLARRVAVDLERERPKQIISRMVRSERGGKVFIDWSQNAEHKTTVSAYSVRAKREQPFVSMPISWTELESALAKRDIQALMFEPQRAVERVRKLGDLFAPVLSLEQTIPQDILKQMKLPGPQSPKPVVLPATSDAPHSLPRSSGQGGRKLFVLHRAGTDFELALEVNGLFQAMRLVKFPTKKGAKSDARAVGERDLSSVTEESASSGIVWDLGTYEVVEGSYKKGALEVYLSGRKLDGEWSLKKVDGSTWQVGNITGRLKRGLPGASSALAGMETSAPKSGRRRDAR